MTFPEIGTLDPERIPNRMTLATQGETEGTKGSTMHVGKLTGHYRYGKTSRERLATCHPDLQLIFTETLAVMDHSIICGRRGKEAQDMAESIGASKVAWPLSLHNCPIVPENQKAHRGQWFAIRTAHTWEEDPDGVSMAIDVAPYIPELGGVNWGNKGSSRERKAALRAFVYLAGVVAAVTRRLILAGKITHAVRWGGDWDGDRDMSDQTFNDLAHYELTKL